jgi:threonine synthase
MGLVETGRRPRMIVVQSTGCAPMVKAWEDGKDHAPRWENPRTYASGLRVPAAVGDHLILAAVRESGGAALAVPDAAMDEGQRAMASLEGIFPAPEGGATVAAIRRLVEQGAVDADERVVLFNTGTGLKYPDAPGALD